MKKQILSIALSTAFSIGLAMAAPAPQDQQAPPPGEGRHMPNPEEQAKRLGERLHLTDDQVTQIKPILADTQAKLQALRDDASTSREDRMAKVKTIREDSDTKIKAVLTDDQKAQYDKMVEERGKMMRARRQNGGGNQ